ncbi:MAG: PepSY domain-containing protein [Clostridiales bacterium]|nr:PepSY domain-containing protein [Clostridiales bacterium]
MKKGMLIAIVFALIALAGCAPHSTGISGDNTQSQTSDSLDIIGVQENANAAEPKTVNADAQAVQTAQAAAPMGSNTDIGEAKAKEIALDHADLKETDVVFVRVHLDYDDGWREYEVEFYSGNVEYDYDIDSVSGEIRSYDRDAEYYVPTPPKTDSQNAADIGEAKAKETALSHAGYTADKVQRLKAERDYDDGRLEYEVEFYVGNIEYSYEIDATNGTVLNYEAEQND